MTERVKLEKKLREESGLVRVGELAAVLAHEIKNPLAAVSGAIQMLSEHMSSAEDREIADEILRRLDGLSALMSDLLLFARPPRPQMRPVELAGLFDALVGFLKADPAWAEIDVVVEGHARHRGGGPGAPEDCLPEPAPERRAGVEGAAAAMRSGEPPPGRHVHDRRHRRHRSRDSAEHRERLFTPFFTTKSRGTVSVSPPSAESPRRTAAGSVVHETGPRGTTVRVTLPGGIATQLA